MDSTPFCWPHRRRSHLRENNTTSIVIPRLPLSRVSAAILPTLSYERFWTTFSCLIREFCGRSRKRATDFRIGHSEATASFGMGDDASPCDWDANLCQDQDISVLRTAWLEMNDA